MSTCFGRKDTGEPCRIKIQVPEQTQEITLNHFCKHHKTQLLLVGYETDDTIKCKGTSYKGEPCKSDKIIP